MLNNTEIIHKIAGLIKDKIDSNTEPKKQEGLNDIEERPR